MTPEQRAVKWFEKVPEADDLSFDQRLAICKKTGNTMAFVFVVLFSLELILAYMLTDGSFVFTMTDFLNKEIIRPKKVNCLSFLMSKKWEAVHMGEVLLFLHILFTLIKKLPFMELMT